MHNKIFCIGLSRTGTTSVHGILEKLGFKSKHFVGPLLNDDWEVVDRFDALGDTPIPLLFKECDARYPGSKFILTTRDKADWLESMKWMFRHGRVIWKWPLFLGHYHQRIYGVNHFDQKVLVRAFDNYHAEVSAYFASRPNDLLEVNIDDGICVEEICQFLETPFRPVKVPRSNTRTKATPWQFVIYYASHYVITPLNALLRKL